MASETGAAAAAAHQTQHAKSILDQISLVQVGKDEYVSATFPQRMGNMRPIAYGGCATAIAVNAAFQTIQPGFNVYSILGYFLGPALIDRPIRCHVHRVRDTRTFATRRVTVSQVFPDGRERNCLELTADFQATEKGEAMAYDPRLSGPYKPPSQTPTADEHLNRFVAEGKMSKKQAELLTSTFGLMASYFDQRLVPEGHSSQKMLGFAKHEPTTQDHLHLTDKLSVEWMQAKAKMTTQAENVSALAFNMDGGLSFLPLIHDDKFLDDAGDCSSLDFALRIFSPKVDLNEWHLKERKTIAGGHGRTYSEARLFDQNGKLVAIESQQGIMRPKKAKPAL
ncbi:hypothetical protein B0A52_03110 [Exophiala mesophila]|uniref:Acyl-CoA thioesterase II n=1 Tax=Exophiala mesophila TaxID=212818 RepID=A0A438NCG2_EXOME|nr:hypothetical protein B0A52_03110 [Exophiala mesophila]